MFKNYCSTVGVLLLSLGLNANPLQLSAVEYDKISLSILGKEGHGGSGVVCRAKDDSIKSAELLDLYEERIHYGRLPMLSIENSDGLLKLYATKIQKNFEPANIPISDPNMVYDLVNKLKTKIRYIPKEAKLKPINDNFPVTLPKGCKIEQIANYVNRNLVLVDQQIYRKMDKYNQASLLVHEFMYMILRSYGEVDSRRTRKLIGTIVTGAPIEAVHQGIPMNSMTCYGEDKNNIINYLFDAFETKKGTVLQFHLISNNLVLSKKTIQLFDNNSFVNGVMLNDMYSDSFITESLIEGGETFNVYLTKSFKTNNKLERTLTLSDADRGINREMVKVNCFGKTSSEPVPLPGWDLFNVEI